MLKILMFLQNNNFKNLKNLKKHYTEILMLNNNLIWDQEEPDYQIDQILKIVLMNSMI